MTSAEEMSVGYGLASNDGAGGDTFNSGKWSKKGVLMPRYQGLLAVVEKVCGQLGRTMPILLR
jgi:hypothetical protein